MLGTRPFPVAVSLSPLTRSFSKPKDSKDSNFLGNKSCKSLFYHKVSAQGNLTFKGLLHYLIEVSDSKNYIWSFKNTENSGVQNIPLMEALRRQKQADLRKRGRL